MRILLLCSAFNGLTQRAWIALREAGHEVSVEFASSGEAMISAVGLFDPELIICPFLRERVPAEVWQRHRTIIVHPGPKGDRGPSSLDWALMEGEQQWGVTALQAVEEMDAGPIWATRPLAFRTAGRPKSAVYNGPVADAAIELIGEVVAKAADPSFRPEALDYRRGDVIGRLRPSMRHSDRQFDWSEDTDAILRRIAAADGSPGVRTTIGGVPAFVFDAHRGPPLPGRPGSLVGRRNGAVLVRTGDGCVWIGQVRIDGCVKLPATMALRPQLGELPDVLRAATESVDEAGRREISYRSHGDVGVLRIDFYNGAMSTGQCRRLRRHSATPCGSRPGCSWSAAESPSATASISTSSRLLPRRRSRRGATSTPSTMCAREIITATDQLVVTSVGANAGAGGVMLALGADHVMLRDGVVLNPHYATMGLYGSEYWTYVLPRRVGDDEAIDSPKVACRSALSRPDGRGLSTTSSPARRTTSRTPSWSTPPGSPAAPITSDCCNASVRRAVQTSSASRSTPIAPRSWPR